MEQYIPKSVLAAEIERLDDYWHLSKNASGQAFIENLLSFLDTLEVKENDTKCIDKDAVVAEIERKVKCEETWMEKQGYTEYHQGLRDAYKGMLSFLETLVVKENDTKCIDKDAIVAEIKGLMRANELYLSEDNTDEIRCQKVGAYSVLNDLLHFLDTLGTKEADSESLDEKAIAKYLFEKKGYPISLNGNLPSYEETMKSVNQYMIYKKEQFIKKAKEAFCKATCKGYPSRSTCTSLGTCKEYDNFIKLMKGE